ncbi:SH3 domain-containing protein [Pseudoruegeria sp. SK021]|uniref:SH3 domain-containing protein n=1 Tax=Pseudoruegeria sp. SK021 TaxID=1933035 RepID=UPI000A219F51|nr:SH3 domain-containing protein [Pseudoruegeria sp. SK021]OSP55110.1 hypothetical protein BV911_08755 [Pseudoruegeria sp. SK021]
MALKLTILLAGLIFMAMYLAGDSDGPSRSRTATGAGGQTGTTAPDAPAPPEADRAATAPDPSPEPQADIAPAPPAAPSASDAPVASMAPDAAPTGQTMAEAEAESEVAAEAEDDAPVVLPGLGMSGLSFDSGSDALSLADGVRARMAEDPAQPLRRPEAPPPVTAQTAPDAPAPAATDTGPSGSTARPMARVTATAVNLRAGPSTAEAVVGRASEGDLVEVTGTPVPGWSAIRDPATGNTVYMATDFLLMQSN